MWNNYWDDEAHTKSASSAESDFPLANIVNRWHTRHWRSTDDTAEWVKIDLSEAKDVQALVMKYHNLTGSATVKLQGNATDSWGSPSVDATVTVTTETIVHFLSSVESYRWWRVSLVDASNPDTYIRIGRLFLGTYFSPEYNFTNDYRYTMRDPSVKAYSSGGQVSVNQKAHYRMLQYYFQFVHTPDDVTFEDIFNAVGQSIPYFITQDADTSGTTYYVQNATDWDLEHLGLDEWFSLPIELEEMR